MPSVTHPLARCGERATGSPNSRAWHGWLPGRPERRRVTVSVMAPSFEPDGASDAALLAERLTVLRLHRFDAHVAAWRAAGLTATQIRR